MVECGLIRTKRTTIITQDRRIHTVDYSALYQDPAYEQKVAKLDEECE